MHREQFADVVPVERDQIGDLLTLGLASLNLRPASISKLISAGGESLAHPV